jgi:hypothetical protein
MSRTVRPRPDLSAADPWAARSPVDAAPRSKVRTWPSVLAVTVLGSFGPVLRIGQRGSQGRLDAGVLLVCAAAFALALRPGRRPVWRAVLVLVSLAAVPLVGPLPTTAVAFGVLVADAALVPRRRFPLARVRTVPHASLAVLPTVLAGWAWFHGARVAWFVAWQAAAAAIVIAYDLDPRRSARLDRALARGISAIARAVGSAVLFAALLVVAYLPGAIVNLFGRRSRRLERQGSTWEPTPLDLRAVRRDASYPFATVHPHEARRRIAGGLTAVAVISAAAWFAVRSDPPSAVQEARAPVTVPSTLPDQEELADHPVVFAKEFAIAYSKLPAYRGATWADRMEEEEIRTPQTTDRSEGRYINIRDGVRVTARPRSCDCEPASIWITGGSAVWGVGQRDDHTIASELVHQGPDIGRELTVTNLGVRGIALPEEIALVEQRLESGERPDLIVFYTGFNETGTVLADEMVKGGNPIDIALVKGSRQDLEVAKRMAGLDAINDRAEEYLRSNLGGRMGERTAAGFSAAQDRMASIAQRYGVDVVYFFQPDAFASTHQLEPYRLISGVPTEDMQKSPMGVALTGATDILGDRVVNLRHVFDDEPDQIFLGLVHHNEKGARIVAEAMLPTIDQHLGGR